MCFTSVDKRHTSNHQKVALYKTGKISIEHFKIFSCKYISKGFVSMKLIHILVKYQKIKTNKYPAKLAMRYKNVMTHGGGN